MANTDAWLRLDAYPALWNIALFTFALSFLLFSYTKFISLFRVRSLIRNLPNYGRGSWFSGNISEVTSISNTWHYDAVKRYGGVVQIQGILGNDMLYIADPRALHHILVKDMHKFPKPRETIELTMGLLGPGLLTAQNAQHRNQRKILNPVFHIKHMRGLIPVFCKVTRRVTHVLDTKLKNGQPKQEINMFDWLSRLALELVGQAGLGYSFDSLKEGEKCEYTAVVKELMPVIAKLVVFIFALPPLIDPLPKAVKLWLANHLPIKAMREMKYIADVMKGTSKEALRLKQEQITRHGDSLEERGLDLDILTVLLRANARVSESERLSEEEVLGQMTTLIFAAQDTTSSALARTLHLLALHPDAQTRLREEVLVAHMGVFGDEDWTYDALNALPYLDAVCRETLRVYPPVVTITRIAREATALPLLRPVMGTDGKTITTVPVAKGQSIIVALAAANRDEAVWGAEAHTWKPERWLGHTTFGDWRDIFEAKEDWDGETGKEKETKLPGVYSGMMTFSGGGKACIGFKFSLLEMKVVLAMLIKRFKFELPNEEIVWNMTGVQTPSLKGHEMEMPTMPLNVSLA